VATRKEKAIQQWREEKAARAEHKEVRPNRKPKRTRQKEWNQFTFSDPEDWLDVDYDRNERVMPHGEQSAWRDTVTETTIELDRKPQEEQPVGEGWVRGLVVEAAAGLYRVRVEERELLCSVRGSLSVEDTNYTNIVAVGDDVLFSESLEQEGVIERVLPRRSVLARPDVFYSHLNQVIVANVDQVLIVASWREPHIWLELIDRYLVSSRLHNLTPVICVNKTDLAESLAECRAEMKPYIQLGYEVIYTSAMEGRGIKQLRGLLRDKVTVLAGMSGVGKSSLLKAIQPGLDIRVRDVSDHWHEGRHTTTQVNMLPLEMGGYVVDTPGIREFGLSGLHRDELAGYYPEFLTAGDCRFSDCVHLDEPECAVRRAVEAGEISETRYYNYLKIYETLPE